MSDERELKVSKKTIITTTVTAVVVIGILVSILLYVLDSSGNTAANKKNGHPDYQTVLPNGKSIETLGGWERISPESSTPVYAYADKVGDVSISVSEQPLPDSFKNNVDAQVTEVAKKFNATTSIDTKDTKVFLGTSAKGPQSVIFAKEGLLVLIKSQQKISNDEWKEYITSLTSFISAKY